MTRAELLARLDSWDKRYDKAFKHDEDGDGDWDNEDTNWDLVHAVEDEAVELAQWAHTLLKEGVR